MIQTSINNIYFDITMSIIGKIPHMINKYNIKDCKFNTINT